MGAEYRDVSDSGFRNDTFGALIIRIGFGALNYDKEPPKPVLGLHYVKGALKPLTLRGPWPRRRSSV